LADPQHEVRAAELGATPAVPEYEGSATDGGCGGCGGDNPVAEVLFTNREPASGALKG